MKMRIVHPLHRRLFDTSVCRANTLSNPLVKRFDVRLWLHSTLSGDSESTMPKAREQKDRTKTAAARRRARAARPQLASAPARPTQREILLDEAARQFNARGIAATSVNQVAK